MKKKDILKIGIYSLLIIILLFFLLQEAVIKKINVPKGTLNIEIYEKANFLERRMIDEASEMVNVDILNYSMTLGVNDRKFNILGLLNEEHNIKFFIVNLESCNVIGDEKNVACGSKEDSEAQVIIDFDDSIGVLPQSFNYIPILVESTHLAEKGTINNFVFLVESENISEIVEFNVTII